MSSYNYAPPLYPARSPRDAGNKMYPEEVVRNTNEPAESDDSPYWLYLNDPTDPDPSFLGPSPQHARGQHPVHALVSDGFFAGPDAYTWDDGRVFIRDPYEGYHLQSYNVLYGDFHAKRILDPRGQIHAAKLTPIRYTGSIGKAFKIFKVWDYFSQNP